MRTPRERADGQPRHQRRAAGRIADQLDLEVGDAEQDGLAAGIGEIYRRGDARYQEAAVETERPGVQEVVGPVGGDRSGNHVGVLERHRRRRRDRRRLQHADEVGARGIGTDQGAADK